MFKESNLTIPEVAIFFFLRLDMTLNWAWANKPMNKKANKNMYGLSFKSKNREWKIISYKYRLEMNRNCIDID